MLLDPFSRFFVKFDLVLRPYRGRGAPLRMIAEGDELDALDVLQSLFDAKQAFMEIKKGDVLSLSALDYREKEGLLILFFRRRDANATTQVYEHEETGNVRTAERDKKEHPAVSAHLVIDLRDRKKVHPTYRAVLEEVPGIGPSYVNKILSLAVSSKKYEATNEKGVAQETYTIADLDGLASETLGQAVAGGGIDYVELVRPADMKGLDTKGLLPSPERLRLSVRKGDGVAPMAILKQIQAWGIEKDWKELRVQVRTKEDRSRVVRVDREVDAATVLFVQSEQVTMTNPLPACGSVINEEIVDAAKKMFAAAKDWL